MRRNTGDDEAVVSIQKTESQEVIPEKFDHGREQHFEQTSALASGMLRFGRDVREVIHLPDVFADGAEAIVQDIAFKMFHGTAFLEDITVVRIAPTPSTFAAVPQTQLAIGIPATVPDPGTTVVGQAIHGVAIGTSCFGSLHRSQ